MSDEKKDETAAETWKYTAPTDKKCFNTVALFTAKDCKEADAAKTAKLSDGVLEAYVDYTPETGDA